jgi:hypothetical protein
MQTRGQGRLQAPRRPTCTHNAVLNGSFEVQVALAAASQCNLHVTCICVLWPLRRRCCRTLRILVVGWFNEQCSRWTAAALFVGCCAMRWHSSYCTTALRLSTAGGQRARPRGPRLQPALMIHLDEALHAMWAVLVHHSKCKSSKRTCLMLQWSCRRLY